jgi:4-amino-4-deoxy-L-arabinose transferase-like glycosyltransferase
LNSILGFVAADLIHPPLFYLLLKIWIGIGGESTLWLRMLPAIFSIAAIPLYLLICRELAIRTWTTVLALFFFAVNGALIKYAQEVRMYSLLLLLTTASMLLFLRYLSGKDRIWILALVNLLLVYTHYFGWFVILSELAFVLIWRRQLANKTIRMSAFVLAAFVPWAATVAINASKNFGGFGQNIGWMSRPGPVELARFLVDLIEPFYSQPASTFPSSVFIVSLPLIFILASITVLLSVGSARPLGERDESIKLLAIFAALPVAAALVLSWILPYSIWGTRHLIIVFAPVSILAACGLAAISNKTWRAALITAYMLVVIVALGLHLRRPVPLFSWCVLEDMTRGAMAERIDVRIPKLVVFEDLIAYQLWFAHRNEQPSVEIIKINGIEGLTEDAAFFLPRRFDEVRSITVDALTDDRVVAAFRGRNWDAADPVVKAFALNGYAVVDRQERPAEGETAFLVIFQRSP